MNRSSCPPDPCVPWVYCRCGNPIASDGTACTGPGRHPYRPSSRVRFYATWTSTRANLGEIHRIGGRLLTGPDQLPRYGDEIPPLAWALDNGAWGCFQRGAPFDGDAFRRALARWGSGADWIVLPDVVGEAGRSADLSREWLPEVATLARPMLFAVQDGMAAADVPTGVGIFVGGSTDWKERTAATWGALARERGCYLHIGRVNTARRMQLAIDAGADSVDGTTLSRFSKNGRKMGDAATCDARSPLFAGAA